MHKWLYLCLQTPLSNLFCCLFILFSEINFTGNEWLLWVFCFLLSFQNKFVLEFMSSQLVLPLNWKVFFFACQLFYPYPRMRLMTDLGLHGSCKTLRAMPDGAAIDSVGQLSSWKSHFLLALLPTPIASFKVIIWVQRRPWPSFATNRSRFTGFCFSSHYI